MPVKRTRPPLVLLRSPLVYFLAQVQFSQILKLEEYLPDIQDQLRKGGFPVFRRAQLHQVVFQGDTPSISVGELFDFQNADGTVGIVLTPASIAYQTTRYSVYEDFEPQFRRVLECVDKIVGIGVMLRAGLRYVDLVTTRENESLADYLRQETLGFTPGDIGVSAATSTYILQGKTDIGRMNIRILKLPGPAQPLPQDLMMASLKLDKSIAEGQTGAVLDFDHFSERRTDFKVDSAMEQLGELHEGIETAFMQAVTPKAFELWESQVIN